MDLPSEYEGDTHGEAIGRAICKIAALEKCVEELKAQKLNVTTEAVRKFFEYDIAVDGTVSPIGLPAGPIPTVTWTPGTGGNGAGNDYVVTFPAGSGIEGAYLVVSGDIETGAGGDIDNAYNVQNVTVAGDVVGFSLYSGDDGGGEDDAGRRDVRLMVTCEGEQVAGVTFE